MTEDMRQFLADVLKMDGVVRDKLEARVRALAALLANRDEQAEELEAIGRAMSLPGLPIRGSLLEAVRVLVRDHLQCLDQLGRTQARCTELLDEIRGNRHLSRSPARELHVLGHIVHERRRQDAKWGDCTAPGRVRMKDGTGGPWLEAMRDAMQALTDKAMKDGEDTWAHVFAEEALEVLAAAPGSKELRNEIVQAAAVLLLWAEMIDRRSDASAPMDYVGATHGA